MATDKQIEANRLNAQLCTGPKTEEGKLRSSQNAMKTGIYAQREVLNTETLADYEQLIAEFHNEFSPATPQERSFVDTLIRFEWLTRRYMAVETDVWNRKLRFGAESSIGAAFLQESRVLLRAGNHINAVRRGFAQTLKQLEALQEKRKSEGAKPAIETAPAQPEPEPNQSVTPKLVSFRQPQLNEEPQSPQTSQLPDQQPENQPEAPPIAA